MKPDQLKELIDNYVERRTSRATLEELREWVIIDMTTRLEDMYEGEVVDEIYASNDADLLRGVLDE